ncbi:hypothetical protein HPB49_016305 [Dermacentor silvarum]|uniref:Uncharacterized protein n=1 Tax=Dermacentor silvarum TaxID=543639 RepID=A0ACB8E1A0_DERSI|nr:hypothetical protein HPB49_016305 [Dermacentor silvarum]
MTPFTDAARSACRISVWPASESRLTPPEVKTSGRARASPPPLQKAPPALGAFFSFAKRVPFLHALSLLFTDALISRIKRQREREANSRSGYKLLAVRAHSSLFARDAAGCVRHHFRTAAGGRAEPVFWLSVSVRRESGGLTLGVCSTASGCLAMSSGRRIRPERSAGAQRRNVQKLTWRDSHWLQGFSDVGDQRGGPSASLSDMGVGAALRRVLLLCERQQHREAAALISHLAPAVFRALVAELPVEALLEQLPASLPPLEALYARAAFLEEPATALQALKPDALVLHMVRLFAQQHDADRDGATQWLGPPQMITSCKKLLKVRSCAAVHAVAQGLSAKPRSPWRWAPGVAPL